MNIFASITHFFLKNTALSWLVIVGIFISGFMGFFAMPQQYNPEVTLPAFLVQTQFSGATAEEVEQFVTREMEEKIAEIPGVDTISSESIEGGVSLVRVTFFVGEDLETSKVKLFSKISENIDFIQNPNIANPIIKTITPDDIAIGVWSLTSSRLSENKMREKAISMAHILQEVEGIANVDITGGQVKALKIVIDPQKLKERNISLPEVSQALQYNNGRALIGNLRTAKGLHEIEIDTMIMSEKEARDIIISKGISLGDIATISSGYTEKKSFTTLSHRYQLHNQDAVFLSIAKRKGENTEDVIQRAMEKIEILSQERQYEDINIKNIRNMAKIASDSIVGLGTNLIQSIFIVLLVLMVFLGGRSAFLVALAIPLSLFMVFFMGFLGDQTINKITLFALILSLGLLVDSATVVVENIYRHVKMKDQRDIVEKITDAVGEVGIGLFLSTVTSVIVFLPLTQISGMMGPYMGPLAFFVPAALLCSLFVAYIVTPFLSRYFFQKESLKNISIEESHNGNKENIELSKGIKIPSASVEKKYSFFERFQNGYAHLLRKILNNNALQVLLLFLIFGGLMVSFLLIPFQGVHFQMLPKADNKTLWVTIDAQEGEQYTTTQEIALLVQKEINSLPFIESSAIFTATEPIVDFNGLFRGFSGRMQEHQSSILVTFTDDKEFTSEEMAVQIREKIQPLILSENSNIRVVEDPPGPPVEATFVAKILSENPDAQKNIHRWLQKNIQNQEGVVDIDSSEAHLYPRTTLVIDQKKAKENKVSNYQVFQSLQMAVSPKIIGSFFVDNAAEQSVIEFSLPLEKRNSRDVLLDIAVKNQEGKMIPLSSITRTRERTSQPSLLRDEHRSYTKVFAEMENRSVIYATIDILFDVFAEYDVSSFSLYGVDVVEKQTGEIVRIEWGGEFKMTLDNFRDLLIAMGVAFALVYAILVGQFKSFMVPLLIMATVPLAMLGILPGFALLDIINGTFLTATALIGFIALMGIVVNNAIIYLEYLEQLKNSGMELKEALIEAGRTRLRPILLTSITTILGSLTIVGDPVWSGLAWSIVFGLSLSSVLTLGVFPILYWRSQRT